MSTAVDTDFIERIEPHRRELTVHCYRMLGSIHDAEDLVQETLLRAWRAREGYDPARASVRTWLYRIATNACLTALGQRGRRALPSLIADPADDPEGDFASDQPEWIWVQPIPTAADPESVVAGRTGLRLAMVVALQHLPARQRAVFLLREGAGLRANEIGEMLAMSTAGVNSALQRARARLAELAPDSHEVAEPNDPDVRRLVDRYARAFERADLDELGTLMRDDITFEMPPVSDWFSGRELVLRLLAAKLDGGVRMVPVPANDQPAFALYVPSDGHLRAHSIHVLDADPHAVRRVVDFQDPSLFKTFDLPLTWDAKAEEAAENSLVGQ
jgi:RNA polymerase sigma-70 factor (ECF subfamily)